MLFYFLSMLFIIICNTAIEMEYCCTKKKKKLMEYCICHCLPCVSRTIKSSSLSSEETSHVASKTLNYKHLKICRWMSRQRALEINNFDWLYCCVLRRRNMFGVVASGHMFELQPIRYEILSYSTRPTS